MKKIIILTIIFSFIFTFAVSGNTTQNSFHKEGNYYKNPIGQTIPGVRKRGIDISAYQKEINWEEVAKDDVSFVFIRCANTNQGIDNTFEYNATNALKNGIKIGIYLRTTAVTKKQVLQEAEYIIKEAQKYHVTYPLVIDVEGYPVDQLDNNSLKTIVTTFCEKIKKAGYEPMIYASKYWLEHKGLGSLPYRVWVAQYNNPCTYKGKRSFWQCSCKGRIKGIKGDVDIDFQY